MSILENKIRSDKESREVAEREVMESHALQPTDAEMQYVNSIIRTISDEYREQVASNGLDGIHSTIEERVKVLAAQTGLPYLSQNKIQKVVLTSIFGLGPLEEYMRSGTRVTDIVVGPYNHICVEDETGMHLTDAAFNSEEHLIQVINRIIQQVGRTLNLAHPMVDARLKDGSRVNATIPPATPDGATLTIRRFPEKSYTGEDFINFGSMNRTMLEFLALCVKGRASIIVSGGTTAGKTTVLNMLSSYIPDNELIITIEDSCELRLLQPNVRRMEAREAVGDVGGITTCDLVKNSLRMRPDRIIVGEVRDETIVDMMSAMSTGHDGSMGTIHANSPQNLVNSRIRTLYSQYKGGSFSTEGQQIQFAEAVQLIVQISKVPGKGRKITHITAVDGVDDRGIILHNIFEYDNKTDMFRQTDYYPQRLADHLARSGVYIEDFFNDKKAIGA